MGRKLRICASSMRSRSTTRSITSSKEPGAGGGAAVAAEPPSEAGELEVDRSCAMAEKFKTSNRSSNRQPWVNLGIQTSFRYRSERNFLTILRMASLLHADSRSTEPAACRRQAVRLPNEHAAHHWRIRTLSHRSGEDTFGRAKRLAVFLAIGTCLRIGVRRLSSDQGLRISLQFLL